MNNNFNHFKLLTFSSEYQQILFWRFRNKNNTSLSQTWGSQMFLWYTYSFNFGTLIIYYVVDLFNKTLRATILVSSLE